MDQSEAEKNIQFMVSVLSNVVETKIEEALGPLQQRINLLYEHLGLESVEEDFTEDEFETPEPPKEKPGHEQLGGSPQLDFFESDDQIVQFRSEDNVINFNDHFERKKKEEKEKRDEIDG